MNEHQPQQFKQRSGRGRTAAIVAGTVLAASVVASGAAFATFTALNQGSDGATAPTTQPEPNELPSTTLALAPIATIPSTTTAPPTTAPAPVMAPEVASRLSSFTTWQTPTAVSVDDRSGSVSTGARVVDGRRSETTCRPQGLGLVSRVFTEFPVGGFSGTVLPGLIVEGAGIPSGDLRVVPLERAPLELLSTADSFQNVQAVANPEASDLQQAVTALKRDADVRLSADGVDVVASDITFSKSETHSFEQSTLELGISLHYESLTRSAGFEGSFSMNEAVERHSIVVRLVQPMFQIRMELDGSESPADFFSATVTEAQLSALEAQGRLGVDNPPVVIDAVTYGRVMYYTLTSSEVDSSSELTAIVDGSFRGIDGEASLSAEQEAVLRGSEVQLIAYGGDQNMALDAIKSGDLGHYFGAANTATAAPLTMTMRTLDGRPIDVADEATLQEVVCDTAARPYEFQVILSSIVNGTVVVSTEKGGKLDEASEGEARGDASEGGANNFIGEIPGDRLNPGWNLITFTFTPTPGGCTNVFAQEKFEASIRSRSTVGSGEWGTRNGRISFHQNQCKVATFQRWVNTNTGEITAVDPAKQS